MHCQAHPKGVPYTVRGSNALSSGLLSTCDVLVRRCSSHQEKSAQLHRWSTPTIGASIRGDRLLKAHHEGNATRRCKIYA